MPLDLESLSAQIEEMTQSLSLDASSDRLQAARAEFVRQDAALVRARLDDPKARPAWLVGYPLEPLTNRYPLPSQGDDFCVVASDGSAIYPDRHSPVRYYVVNSGYAILTYGAYADAELGSQCQLFYADEDVYVSPKYQTLPIDGALVAVKMAVSEMEILLLAVEAATEPDVVALRDGTLILWGLDSPGLSEDVRNRFLGPYLEALETLRERRAPVASYISFPGSDEVINALRVGMCPDNPVVCALHHLARSGHGRLRAHRTAGRSAFVDDLARRWRTHGPLDEPSARGAQILPKSGAADPVFLRECGRGNWPRRGAAVGCR